MAKNDKLINSLRAVASRNRDNNIIEMSNMIVPELYAAVAIALYHQLDAPDDEKEELINSVFAESEKIWTESVDKDIDICKKCIDEINIELRGR